MLDVFIRSLPIIFVFFFFQAEDGIRDLTVTGVQTCALPICAYPSRAERLFHFRSSCFNLSRGSVCPTALAISCGPTLGSAPRRRSAVDRESRRVNSTDSHASFADFCFHISIPSFARPRTVHTIHALT